MMQNSSNDLTTFIENDLGQPCKKSGNWLFWLCPFHADKNTPSLGINRKTNTWHCFGCNKGGDAIAWVHIYHNLSYEEALQRLNIPSDQAPTRQPASQEHQDALPPAPKWQQRACAFVTYAQDQLWKNHHALDYLFKKRLLEEKTIRRFHLGYNPTELWDLPERWGLALEDVKRIWLPKGFVIPCFVESSLWYLKIRRPNVDPKYVYVRGGSPALFGADDLFGAPLVLLTEGEFDCMLTWQLLHDVAGVATLGSASKKLDLSRWARYLLPAEEIIAVLDNDDAGKTGTQSLAMLSAQIHPLRIPSLSPGGKDITDYVQAGGDLWEWLKHHLVRIESQSSQPSGGL